MNCTVRSSRVTGPKMRVPIGSPCLLISTAALLSKRMTLPSPRRMADAVQIEECRPISKRKTWTVMGEAMGVAPGLARRRARAAAPDEEIAAEAEGAAEVAAVEAGAAL